MNYRPVFLVAQPSLEGRAVLQCYRNHSRVNVVHTALVCCRCECPRDPLCVHAATPLPEVGPSYQTAAVQGLSVCEPENLRHAELCRADQLPQIRSAGYWFSVGPEPGAAGISESSLPGGADPTCGGGQLEVR